MGLICYQLDISGLLLDIFMNKICGNNILINWVILVRVESELLLSHSVIRSGYFIPQPDCSSPLEGTTWSSSSLEEEGLSLFVQDYAT